jgi:CelD/BcsL family acetyltransferase involved in cellulose biosynthesis
MQNEDSFTVSLLTTNEEMDSLREEWDDLLLRDKNASLFQTWEWVSAYRWGLGGRTKLVVLCVREGFRLVGLGPLEVVRMYGLPLRRLQFVGTGVFDYLDFILDSDLENQTLAVTTKWIEENSSMWDLLDLQNLPQVSPSLQLAGYFDASDRLRAELMEGEVCPYLPLADSWETMLGRFGKKMRYNLGYHERVIRRDFKEVDLTTLGESELSEGMDAFFRLHTMRWKKRWLPGVLTGERKQRFHREVAKSCLDNGSLKLHGLRLDGRLQAVLYCFEFNGKGYYYLGGFDPALSKYSLGTILTGFAIRKAIESGCSEFDFLRGNENYKSRWTKEYRTNSRFVLSKNTLRSRIAVWICRLEHQIECWVKHELHKRIGAG